MPSGHSEPTWSPACATEGRSSVSPSGRLIPAAGLGVGVPGEAPYQPRQPGRVSEGHLGTSGPASQSLGRSSLPEPASWAAPRPSPPARGPESGASEPVGRSGRARATCGGGERSPSPRWQGDVDPERRCPGQRVCPPVMSSRRAIPEGQSSLAGSSPVRTGNDAFQELARAVSIAGRTLKEVGLLLKHRLMSSAIRLGKVAQIMTSITVGSGSTVSIPQELPPLPVAPTGPVEAHIAQALCGGVQPTGIAANFPTTVRDAGRRAWLFFVVLAINYMTLGRSPPSRLAAPAPSAGAVRGPHPHVPPEEPAPRAQRQYLRQRTVWRAEGGHRRTRFLCGRMHPAGYYQRRPAE